MGFELLKTREFLTYFGLSCVCLLLLFESFFFYELSSCQLVNYEHRALVFKAKLDVWFINDLMAVSVGTGTDTNTLALWKILSIAWMPTMISTCSCSKFQAFLKTSFIDWIWGLLEGWCSVCCTVIVPGWNDLESTLLKCEVIFKGTNEHRIEDFSIKKTWWSLLIKCETIRT